MWLPHIYPAMRDARLVIVSTVRKGGMGDFILIFCVILLHQWSIDYNHIVANNIKEMLMLQLTAIDLSFLLDKLIKPI